jgi:hypothetical protein
MSFTNCINNTVSRGLIHFTSVLIENVGAIVRVGPNEVGSGLSVIATVELMTITAPFLYPVGIS